MRRYALKLAYDGSPYCGWQNQENALSVQEVLEKALCRASKSQISVVGAGRTDTGVHALGQVGHFDWSRDSMCAEQIMRAVKLPPTIKILEIEPVAEDFHARFSAVSRSYIYKIAKNSTPFNRLYSGYFGLRTIEMSYLREAAYYFLGEHDFSTFAKPNRAVKNKVCKVEYAYFTEDEHFYCFHIKANRFLHNMVRRILGTMIVLSHKNYPPQTVLELIKQENPNQKLVYTSPAGGLYFYEADYPAAKLIWKNSSILLF